MSRTTDHRIKAKVINIDGRAVIKVTRGQYLLGAGYFPSVDAVVCALASHGYSLADLQIEHPDQVEWPGE